MQRLSTLLLGTSRYQHVTTRLVPLCLWGTSISPIPMHQVCTLGGGPASAQLPQPFWHTPHHSQIPKHSMHGPCPMHNAPPGFSSLACYASSRATILSKGQDYGPMRRRRSCSSQSSSYDPMAEPFGFRAASTSTRTRRALPARGSSDQAPPDAEQYWREVLSKITRTNLQDMVRLMNPSHPIGMSLDTVKAYGASVMVYDLYLSYKKQFPKHIILIQLGEFYETIGVDALVLMHWLGFRPMAGDKMIPKAGAPKTQLSKVVLDLNSHGFSVAILVESIPTSLSVGPQKRSKDRSLLGVSSPAHPLYIPPSGARERDQSNLLFAKQRPIVGIGYSRAGFTCLSFYPDLRKVQIWDSMSWEAVMAMLGAKGAAALLLHSSLDDMQRQSCRRALVSMGRQEYGNYETYSGEMKDGFIRMVQKMMMYDIKDENGELTTEAVNTFDVVYNQDQEEGRPQPLPRSTVIQLGLEGDMGIRDLSSTVLPKGSLMCQDWVRQLLLLPPPPRMAMHIQGIIRHLSTSDAPGSDLNTDLPGSKVTEVLYSKQGDAGFFRELYDMVQAVVDMLDDQRHAGLWVHALAYTTWMDMRPLGETNATQLWQSLTHAMDKINRVVVLKEKRRDVGPGGSSLDMDYDDEPSPSRSGSPGSKEPKQEVDMFWTRHEEFRDWVTEERLGKYLKEVDKARRELDASVQLALDTVMKHVTQLGRGNTGRGKVLVRCLDDDTMVLQIPKASLLTPTAIKAISTELVQKQAGELSPINDPKKGNDMYMTQAMQHKTAAYLQACERAENEARRLLRELCHDLHVGYLQDLLLAHRCSIVITSLAIHLDAAKQAGWTVPTLQPYPSQNDPDHQHTHQDNSSSPAQANSGTSQVPAQATSAGLPQMSMDLQQYWPYWMPQHEPTVLNDVRLDRLQLLTGPNMAGKSTVLRSVCAVAILANCGLMVPAKSANVPFYDAYLLRNFSGDSPVENMSSFALEMQEVSNADRQCGPRSLVLLDEMGKGTEVAKGTALCAALILDWCSRGFTGIFATHLHALVPITQDRRLEAKGQLAYKRMGLTETSENGSGRRGTWRLEDGWCFESLAFEVARKQGMRRKLLDDAEEIHQQILEGRYPLTGENLGRPRTTDIEPTAEHERGEGTGSPSPSPPLDVLPSLYPSSPSPSPSPPPSTVYIMPTRTLDEALDVMRQVVDRHFEQVDLTEDQLPRSFILNQRQTVPVKHSQCAAVYVVQWECGWFYCGETNCVQQRLKEHRREPTKTLKLRGPNTSITYMLMPQGYAHVREELEPLIIQALEKEGFNLSSTRDKGKVRVARSQGRRIRKKQPKEVDEGEGEN